MIEYIVTLDDETNDDLKKVTWKAWALLCFFCAGCTHSSILSLTIWQALDNASNFTAASPLWTSCTLEKSMPFAAWSAALCPSPWVCCAIRSASHSHCSLSVIGSVFLLRQTQRGHNCVRPYPIPRSILKILDELSTFTFRQPTRWVGLTYSKSTSLCQSKLSKKINVLSLSTAFILYVNICMKIRFNNWDINWTSFTDIWLPEME
jgi:hypothetical protein